MRRSSIILIFILFCILSSYGQHKEANVWIFGKHVGLDFNFTPPAILHSPAILTQEGCASIADSLGALAFYTDGVTIWNRNDQIMMNGTQLGGHNSSTQSGIIVPKPNDPNFYYVFTVPYQGDPVGLQYSEVDMTLAGGLGGVTENKNKQLISPVTEKVTAMSHYNNEDIWVITHKWQDMEIIGSDTFYIPSSDFYAYLVTDEGVDSIPVISSVGIEHGGSDLNTVGYLKGSPDGERIALAIFHSDVYQLFEFNCETGVINSPITFEGYKRAYGLEFSPNSRILYLSEEDAVSQNLMHIYQIDLFAGTPQEIVDSKTLIGTTTNEAAIGRGALQVGPDQRIYIARGEMNYLGVINNPNIWGSFECGFVNDGIWLECNTSNISKYGLPTFIQTYFSPPHFIYDNFCFGDETQFEISSDTTGYQSVFWEFGDSATSIELNPTHTYAAAGDYVVTLTIFYETTERIAEELITILTSPDPAFSYDDYCFGDPTQFHDQSSPNGGTISDWNWDFGDGTSTVQNPQHTFGNPGQHDVSLNVITSNGCENTIVQTVDQIPPPPAPNTPTGPQEVCQGSAGIPYQTSSVIGANSYFWEIDPSSAGIISGGSINAIVDWDPLFSGTAYISVSGVNVCGDLGATSGSLEITINALPDVFAGEDQNILYETSTIIDDASVSGVPPFTYSWEPADSLIDAGILNPTTVILYTPTYFTLTVEDGNDCIDSDEVYIDIFGGPLGLIINVDSDSICFGEQIQLHADAWGGSEEYTYTWTSDPAGFTSTQVEPVVNPEITTTYYLTIFDGFNYKDASVVITVIDLPVVFAGDDINIPNGTPIQLNGSVNGGAGAPYSYSWTPGNLLVSPYAPDPWTVNLYNTEAFTLTGSDYFGCANTSMVTVNVSDDILHVNLFSEDSCVCYGYTTNLVAAAGGGNIPNYAEYHWLPSESVVYANSANTPTEPIYDTTTFIMEVWDGYNWAFDSITINMLPLPEINLRPKGYDVEDTIFVCVYDTIELITDSPGYFHFLWPDGDTSSSIRVQTTGIGWDMQTHWVTVTNPETECFDIDTVTVIFSFNECTGIYEEDENAYILSYPNPTNGIINVELKGITGLCELTIADIRGKIIQTRKLDLKNGDKTLQHVDLSSYPTGVYLIKVVSQKAIHINKVVLH